MGFWTKVKFLKYARKGRITGWSWNHLQIMEKCSQKYQRHCRVKPRNAQAWWHPHCHKNCLGFADPKSSWIERLIFWVWGIFPGHLLTMKNALDTESNILFPRSIWFQCLFFSFFLDSSEFFTMRNTWNVCFCWENITFCGLVIPTFTC